MFSLSSAGEGEGDTHGYEHRLGNYVYNTKDQLGKGAYGKVYKAFEVRRVSSSQTHSPPDSSAEFHEIVGDAVALKQMSAVVAEDGVAAASLREITVLLELSHCLQQPRRAESITLMRGLAAYAPRKAGEEEVVPVDSATNCPLRLSADSELAVAAPVEESKNGEGESVYGSAYRRRMDVPRAIEEGRNYLVHIRNVMYASPDSAIHVAIEYCEGGDLWHFLRPVVDGTAQPRRIESPAVFRRWMRELAQALAFMHSRHLSHRDLKPQNLMLYKPPASEAPLRKGEEGCLGAEYMIKVGDFGLSRVEDIPYKKYVHEAVTLWYRSPDVALGSTHYTYTADAWSAACIMAEVASGRAIFRGRDEKDQLKRIFLRLVNPTLRNLPLVMKYPSSNKFADCLSSFGIHASADEKEEGMSDEELNKHVDEIKEKLKEYFSEHSGLNLLGMDGIDLLARLFVYDPTKRLTLSQALEHPFFEF